MPNTTGAEHRISYLLFRDRPAQYHPTTIHGDDGPTVFSYGLPIVMVVNGGEWLVKSHRNSSVTTNRHIQAAWNVLRAHGYRPSARVTELVMRGPYGGRTLYTYWTQEAMP